MGGPVEKLVRAVQQFELAEFMEKAEKGLS
jgi:hypothetical protein